MKDVWKNVNTSMADFKEMIPEFYDTEKGGEFCTNIYGINFGYRHDGAKVGDVELPLWAEGSKLTLFGMQFCIFIYLLHYFVYCISYILS